MRAKLSTPSKYLLVEISGHASARTIKDLKGEITLLDDHILEVVEAEPARGTLLGGFRKKASND